MANYEDSFEERNLGENEIDKVLSLISGVLKNKSKSIT